MSRNEVLRSTVLSYGHVTAACFTEDGHRLLSAIGDGQIRVTHRFFILLNFGINFYLYFLDVGRGFWQRTAPIYGS